MTKNQIQIICETILFCLYNSHSDSHFFTVFFASLFVWLLLCLFVYLCVYLFVYLFLYLFVYLFLCLSVFHPPLFLYCHVMYYQYKLISYLTILTKLFSPRYESKKLLCSNGTMRFIQCFQKVIVRYQRYEQFLRWYII